MPPDCRQAAIRASNRRARAGSAAGGRGGRTGGGAITLAYPPGAANHYSSKGYILLEMAVEQVTGERFSDDVGREVLGRLGMDDSSFEWTAELRARAATGHDWYGRPLPHYDHPTRAQGGLVATAAGVARFITASMEGPNSEPRGRGVISPKSVDMTFSPFDYADDSSLVGMGYKLRTDRGTLVARKSGDHRGFKSIVFALPGPRTGLVILSNSDRAAAGVFADIACPLSGGLEGDPLRTVCGQLYTLRNAHFAIAGALGLGAVAPGSLRCCWPARFGGPSGTATYRSGNWAMRRPFSLSASIPGPRRLSGCPGVSRC